MINNSIDSEAYFSLYEKNKQILIKDFLSNESSHLLYHAIAKIPAHEWNYNFCPTSTTNKEKTSIFLSPKNQVFITLLKKLVQKEYQKGTFSFSFQNILSAEALTLNPALNIFSEAMESDAFKTLIRVVCKLKIQDDATWFLSKYVKDDFLSRHTDKPNGKIGFVYYLSKDWQFDWGGNIEFTTNQNEVISSHSPGFNELLLFSVQNKPAIFHEVKPVLVNTARIAISGWLN